MSLPCLIAATPRAGRWNHRFLVPPEANLSEAEVARWADKARQSDQGTDYLAAVRQDVGQIEGGRSGKELLILIGLPINRLSESDRTTLQQHLHCRLNDLEQLVLHLVDWEREGRQTLVPRQELQEWYQEDVAGIIPNSLAGSARKIPRKHPVWLASFFVVSVVAIASFLMADGLQEKLRKIFSPSQKSAPVANVPLEDVARWAKAIGIETGNAPDSSLVRQLADRLEVKLFLPHKSQDSKKRPISTDDKVRLQRQLNTLYIAGDFPEKIKDDLQDLLKHEGLRKTVTALMIKEKPDRFVFIKEQTDKELLKELIPNGTSEEVKKFRELMKTAKNLASLYDRQGQGRGETLHESVRTILDQGHWHEPKKKFTIDASLAELGVPTQDDAEAAVALIGCLTTPKVTPGFSSFSKWHEALKTEKHLRVFLTYAKNTYQKGQEVDKTFYQLVEQIDEILPSQPK